MCTGLKCQLEECEDSIEKLRDALEKKENEAEILRMQIEGVKLRRK